ncbi:Sensor kinase CusS [Aedoeadaptatus ivorii]|uniref:histidine kinase n=1 Tax=Aedoeadaptatus ivorii TaxID=54006 RepID=A0A448UZT6_9FIRM|nr:HAMP domain-containing sensor histidine kinase [Peptoniphilus ivorii]VEJ34535.1 Sensor kinase CusS [Peptoniphilus ivorii]
MCKYRAVLLPAALFFASAVILWVSPYADAYTLGYFFLLAAATGVHLYVRERKEKRNFSEDLARFRAGIRAEKLDSLQFDDTVFLYLVDDVEKILAEKQRAYDHEKATRDLIRQNAEDIAHQIKTPLAGIGMLLDLARTDPARRAEYLDMVEREMERLGALCDLLLKLAQIDAEAVAPKREPVSLRSLVLDGEMYLEPLFLERNIRLALSDGDVVVQGDRVWLFEAVVNLLKNAAEVSPAGAQVEVEFEDNEIYRGFSVCDRGKGIALEKRKRIFERFYKADPRGEGFGIGLSMVKAVADLHDADVVVESSCAGSRFSVRFYR